MTSDEDDEKLDDFEFAQKKLRALVSSAEEDVQSCRELAQSFEHPRAWEVLAKMLDTTSNILKDISSNRLNKDKVEKIAGPSSGTPRIDQQNNFLISDTAALQREIEKREKAKIEEANTVDVEEVDSEE